MLDTPIRAQSARPRGMTLIEMTIALAVATVLTTLGFAAASEIVREARYRADRSRLYLDIRDARDRATSTGKSMVVREVIGSPQRIQYYLLTSVTCGAPGWDGLGPPPTAQTIEYPTIEHTDSDRALCYDGTLGVAADTIGTANGAALDFARAGGGAVEDVVIKEDGRIEDSWGEFPDEGVLEASDCDVDLDPNCGKVI